MASLPRNLGTLGRYILLEPIGRGGMGIVWAAYDPVLDRKIALKLLVPSLRMGGDLASEARALARVQHEHVVTVYDAGTHRAGEHELGYVAMELVSGCTLNAWLQQATRSDEETLDAFIRAGGGLEAAHAAGLVHRDFKPSNVLLGDDGRLRVSDFGLAVSTPSGDRSNLEAPIEPAPPSFAGTLRYMSPEQLHGLPADARSDQFAFCVALFEALFGQHPFVDRDDVTLVELRAKVWQARLPAPRSRLAARVVPTIMRGLALDPANRWPSMVPLLRALQNARRRRGRRLLVAAGATASLALAIALGWRLADSPRRACAHAADAVGTTWGSVRSQMTAAAFARAGGERVWPHVSLPLDEWTARWRALRVEVCEAERNGTRPTPTLSARRECLDRRLGELNALAQLLLEPDKTSLSFAPQAAQSLTPPESCMSVTPDSWPVAAPVARAALTHLRGTLDRAASLRSLGKVAPALEAAKAAADESARLGWAPLTAEAQLELGRSSMAANSANPAADAYYRALWSAEAVRDDEVRFEALRGLSRASVATSDYGLAERWLETARAVAQHMPADGVRQTALVLDEERLASYRGEYKHCIQSGEKALGIAEKAAPRSSLVVSILINLGRCFTSLDEDERASEYLSRALSLAEAINGHDNPQTASVLLDLGVLDRQRQQYAAALTRYREALAIRERLAGPNDPDCGSVHNNIGNVLREMHRDEEARAELERALAIWAGSYGADSPATAVTMASLGRLDIDEGKLALAETHYQQALEIRRKKMPPGHPALSHAMADLGYVLLLRKKADAVHLLEEALSASEHNADSTASDRARVRFLLARAYIELGRPHAGALETARSACNQLDPKQSREAHADCEAWLRQRSAISTGSRGR